MQIVILDKNENSAKITKSYLLDSGYSDLLIFKNFSEGFEYIKKVPQIVLVDITDLSKEELNNIKEIKNYTQKFIITSYDFSTDNIVKALRMGAKDFLPKPILKDDLIRAIERVENYKHSENSAEIISVYSNKGGIGKTTIAVNLASELANVTGEKVALVDLNLQLGDVSTFLNIKPSFDAGYIIRKLVSSNKVSVEKMLEQYKDTNLYILSDPSYIEQSESITPMLIEKLFTNLKQAFQYIVVDMSSNIDANTLKILDLSDKIMFTMIVNIPSIRNAQRCLNLFKSRNYSKDKVKLIINRYMENDEITVSDIENTLSEKIYRKIPNNYFTIMEAINRGMTIWEINPNSNIGSSFREFASDLADDIAEESIEDAI